MPSVKAKIGVPALPACGYPDLGVHVRNQLFFVEPDHVREVTDFATHLPLPVSSFGNVVYGIHAYTHKFTLDALTGLPSSADALPATMRNTASIVRLITIPVPGEVIGDAAIVTQYGSPS